MNRLLLTNSMMTPLERLHGRFMRAPDHPTGNEPPPQTATESTATTDNTGGNPAESVNGADGEDNSGQGEGLKGFWNTPAEQQPTGESDEQVARESQALGGELRGMIDGFAAPPVFTAEISQQIAEGNFDGANAAIAAANKAAIQASVVANSKLLKSVIERLQSDFEGRIQAALGNKDSTDFLRQTFPQAKDPALAPLVERVWNQALANTKGNREEATRQTRGMLQAMGKEFAPDDIRQPADDPTAGINTSASKSLVDELLGRA